MNYYEREIGTEAGIEGLSPEQTVSMLFSFMNDEAAWTAARKAGITLPQAEQCVTDLWNIFSFRKQVMSNV